MPDKLGTYTQYDPTNYPAETTDDLTDSEVGRDSAAETLTAWPSSNVLPDQYAGPVPSREFETAPMGRNLTGRPYPAKPGINTPATTDNSGVLPSIVPPPGHE